MSKKKKLIARFLRQPKDFSWDELVALLGYLGFEEHKTGKTSGSRSLFINEDGICIRTHKPHPAKIIKSYVINEIKNLLEGNKLI